MMDQIKLRLNKLSFRLLRFCQLNLELECLGTIACYPGHRKRAFDEGNILDEE